MYVYIYIEREREKRERERRCQPARFQQTAAAPQLEPLTQGPETLTLLRVMSDLRPSSLLGLSLLRFVDSNFPGISPWASEFHPSKSRFC